MNTLLAVVEPVAWWSFLLRRDFAKKRKETPGFNPESFIQGILRLITLICCSISSSLVRIFLSGQVLLESQDRQSQSFNGHSAIGFGLRELVLNNLCRRTGRVEKIRKEIREAKRRSGWYYYFKGVIISVTGKYKTLASAFRVIGLSFSLSGSR